MAVVHVAVAGRQGTQCAEPFALGIEGKAGLVLDDVAFHRFSLCQSRIERVSRLGRITHPRPAIGVERDINLRRVGRLADQGLLKRLGSLQLVHPTIIERAKRACPVDQGAGTVGDDSDSILRMLEDYRHAVDLGLCVEREPLPRCCVVREILLYLVERREYHGAAERAEAPVADEGVRLLVANADGRIDDTRAGVIELVGERCRLLSAVDSHQHHVTVVAAEVLRMRHTHALRSAEGGNHVLAVAALYAIDAEHTEDGHRRFAGRSCPLGCFAFADHRDTQRCGYVLRTGEINDRLVGAYRQALAHGERECSRTERREHACFGVGGEPVGHAADAPCLALRTAVVDGGNKGRRLYTGLGDSDLIVLPTEDVLLHIYAPRHGLCLVAVEVFDAFGGEGDGATLYLRRLLIQHDAYLPLAGHERELHVLYLGCGFERCRVECAERQSCCADGVIRQDVNDGGGGDDLVVLIAREALQRIVRYQSCFTAHQAREPCVLDHISCAACFPYTYLIHRTLQALTDGQFVAVQGGHQRCGYLLAWLAVQIDDSTAVGALQYVHRHVVPLAVTQILIGYG